MSADGPSCVLSNSNSCFATTRAMNILPRRPWKLVYVMHLPLHAEPPIAAILLDEVLIVSCKSILSVYLLFAIRMSLVHPLFVHEAKWSSSGYLLFE